MRHHRQRNGIEGGHRKAFAEKSNLGLFAAFRAGKAAMSRPHLNLFGGNRLVESVESDVEEAAERRESAGNSCWLLERPWRPSQIGFDCCVKHQKSVGSRNRRKFEGDGLTTSSLSSQDLSGLAMIVSWNSEHGWQYFPTLEARIWGD